jgi:hypothetical protein
MKSVLLSLLSMVLISSAFAAADEADAVKEAIKKSYVESIHNWKNLDNIDKGFHPGFELLGLRQGELTKYPIESWKEATLKAVEKHPEGPRCETEARFPIIDITGDAAMAKVELYRKDTLIFSDYLFLYRFEDGWKIVSKIYQRH